jgi:MoaA/NifB/PqqE/SkfB family radical SAM enzyme
MLAPTGRSRVVQIHPTRRCNLRCLHCYSSSGPEQREEMPEHLLSHATEDASVAGYNVVSFSGGEPLVYNPLQKLLETAHNCGMITTVTTNGMLLNEKRISALQGRVDLLAISLDGVPDSHNRMRANGKAFETMSQHLEGVRGAGIPFGFIFTLTQYNLHELHWVGEFALREGAKLLQIHPLEEVGRASQCLEGSGPDDIEGNYAFLAAAQLDAKYGDRMRIQLDLLSRQMLEEEPERFFVRDEDADVGDSLLSELISPLIIEPDGTVVPLQFGFARRYSLGNLYDAPLAALGERWRGEGRKSFWKLCRRIFDQITTTPEVVLSNWYEAAKLASETENVDHGKSGYSLEH